MNQKAVESVFALLRSVFRGDPMTDCERTAFSEELLSDIFAISDTHDMAHLIGVGLDKNGLLDERSEYFAKFQKAQMMAIYRYEQLEYEFENVCATLETAQIPFIPLKGSVLRRYYPEPWMRTSCDVDILVHENDLDKAIQHLTEHSGCVEKGRGSHDAALYTESGQHIELHYTLVEDGRANSASKMLKNVWQETVLKNGYRFWYEMTDAMFYFYHIAHMAKHFEWGGCGIRPFIDLWLLDNLQDADVNKREEVLKRGGLLRFATVCCELSQVWMTGRAMDKISAQLQDYTLFGGVYGATQNRIAIDQQKTGGRVGYVMANLVLPYDVIKFHYPVLQKYRWLTPIMQIRRWGKLLFCGHAKRIFKKLKFNQHVTREQSTGVSEFLKNIGL